jgi:hypothetical protein
LSAEISRRGAPMGASPVGTGALIIADIRNGPATTRALPLCEDEQTGRVSRGSVDVSFRVLPNEIEDLGRLGWLVGARRPDDVVTAAVAELVERGIALGLRQP